MALILPNLPGKDLFRVAEAADYLQVTPQCIYAWGRRGLLDLVGPRGARRVTRASIIAFIDRSADEQTP